MTKMLDLPDDQFPDFFWTLERYHQAIEKGVLTEGLDEPLLRETLRLQALLPGK